MEQEILAMFLHLRTIDSKNYFSKNPVRRALGALGNFLNPSRNEFKKAVNDPKNADQVAILDRVKAKLTSVGYDDIGLLETMKADDFVKMLDDIRAELPEDIKKRLQASLTKAAKDARRWYDVTLKAFQDHYERRMKIWAFALSAIVVIWLNANVFEIHKEFSSTKVLRDAAVKLGERLSSMPKDSLIVLKTTAQKDSVYYVPDSVAFKAVRVHIAYIDSMVNAQSFQILRWNSPTGTRIGWQWKLIWDAFSRNMFGWLAMTLLVGLGAPFWYDLLKTVVGVKEKLKSKSNTPSLK
jgi:hypothetical protein